MVAFVAVGARSHTGQNLGFVSYGQRRDLRFYYYSRLSCQLCRKCTVHPSGPFSPLGGFHNLVVGLPRNDTFKLSLVIHDRSAGRSGAITGAWNAEAMHSIRTSPSLSKFL